MNFNPSDLSGVLPALILAAGALVLLTSEVFLRAVQPAALGRAGGQPVTPAQRAEAQLPPGAQGSSQPPPAADRRIQPNASTSSKIAPGRRDSAVGPSSRQRG